MRSACGRCCVGRRNANGATRMPPRDGRMLVVSGQLLLAKRALAKKLGRQSAVLIVSSGRYPLWHLATASLEKARCCARPKNCSPF
jgi:hypothetical protein